MNRYTTFIKRNSAQCLMCGEHIESTHVHDFRYCKCRAVAVDGGHDYLRRVGKSDYYLDTSIWESRGGMSYLGKMLLTHCEEHHGQLRINLDELASKLHWDVRYKLRARLIAIHLGINIVGGS
jgi:hypothetical protein